MNKYLECLAELGVGGAHPGGLQLTKMALEQLAIEEKTKILDVGCGTGQTVAFIAEHYRCEVMGMDAHQMMISKANQRLNGLQSPAKCIHGYAESMPFENHAFDYILSESVLIFTDVSSSIREIRRVLKPNGKLIAIEMILEKSMTDDELEKVKSFYGFSDIFTEEEWRKKFTDHGFEQIEFMKYDVPTDHINMEQTPDFLLSENINEQHFDILHEHQLYSAKYADSLGFRIMTCS